MSGSGKMIDEMYRVSMERALPAFQAQGHPTAKATPVVAAAEMAMFNAALVGRARFIKADVDF